MLSFFLWKGFGYRLCAQTNLVPNWSFESIIKCPGAFGPPTATYAVPWLNPNNETPDLYSICDTQACYPGPPPCTGVPFNDWGFQQPHTGTNYSGMVIYARPQAFSTNDREYIQVKLLDSLKAGKKYCMSFYTSLSNSAYYATSRVGCYISKGAVTNFSQDLISEIPQIESPFHQYLTDTANWMQVQGQYTAIGGENYITIGNFYDDTNTDTYIANSAFKDYASYYYVDDASLHEIEINAGNDTTGCAGQLLTIGKVNTDSSFNSYYWYNTSGVLLDSLHSTLNISIPASTQYVLEKRMCGQSLFDTIHVSIKPVPQATVSITGNKLYICVGDTMQVTATINNTNVSWVYTWQPAQYISNTGVLNPKVYPIANTLYTLTIQNTDTALCPVSYTDTLHIKVSDCGINIPNVFSPNGDGINDTWQVVTETALLTSLQCTIFNRWGIKVFETTNIAQRWDGYSTSGEACTAGTYFYLLNYTDILSNKKEAKGFLELVR